jgi:hypothetical protein
MFVVYKYILKCPKSNVGVLGFAHVFQIQLRLDLFHTVTYMMQLHRKPGKPFAQWSIESLLNVCLFAGGSS